jgi:hypothetical protein
MKALLEMILLLKKARHARAGKEGSDGGALQGRLALRVKEITAPRGRRPIRIAETTKTRRAGFCLPYGFW